MKIACIGTLILFSTLSWAQSQRPLISIPNPLPQPDFNANLPSTSPTSFSGQEYKIGRDDLVEVSVFESPDLGGTSRVTASGIISIPLLGPIDVAGHSVQEVERLIEAALKEKYVNDPHVTVFVREYASQPVSVMGAVRRPSIYQIKGEKSLLDLITMAEGLDPLTAGKTIQVIRRNKAPEAGTDLAGGTPQSITIDIEDLFDNGKTELNIPIEAGDIINVVRAGSIFVVGEVVRPNEFVLRNGKNVTVTQAIALANGTTKDAKKNGCVIYRYHRDGSKEEIHVDYGKILSAGGTDVTMLPNDILFIPANKIKSGLNRALESTISVAMGRLIYTGF
jgi:polysaccharide export outer membrane protein